jgi:Bacterial Ig domain/Bacterial cadherin-like domain
VVLNGTDTDDPDTSLVSLVARAPTKGSLSGTQAPHPFQLTYTTNVNVVGNDTFTFRVRDAKTPYKLSNEATITVHIIDQPQRPNAYNNSGVTLNEDSMQNIDLVATDPDAGTTELTYFLVNVPSYGELYLPSNLSAPLGTGVALATVIGNPAELVVVYVPEKDYFGTDEFRFRVEDEGNRTSTADEGHIALVVRPLPDPPVVYDNWYNGTEDVLLQINLTAVDVDGDLMRTVIEELPQRGQLFDGTMKKIQFPRVIDGITLFYLGEVNGFSDPWPVLFDSFRVRVRDDSTSKLISTNSAVQRIRLMAVNDPPSCVPLQVIGTEDTAVNVTLEGFDVDLSDVVTFWVLSYPRNGTVRVGGTLFTEMDVPFQVVGGEFTYLPFADLSGNPLDSLLYGVRDAEFEANCTVEFVVSAVPEPPVVFDQWITIEEDTQTLLEFTGSDPDENDAVVSLQLFSAPVGGTLRDVSNGQLISTFPTVWLDTVALLYTPFADQTGAPYETFTFRMRDTFNLVSVNNATFRINVTAVNGRVVGWVTIVCCDVL